MRSLLISIILIVPILMSGCIESDIDNSEQSLGCTYTDAINFNSSSIIDDGSCVYADPPSPILGCMYSDALNHNPSATLDDGTCRYPVVPDPVPGCTYSEAYNYEMNATEDDGSCVYDSDGDGIKDKDDQCPNLAGSLSLGGCRDSDGDGVCDEVEVAGCQDEAACNYN